MKVHQHVILTVQNTTNEKKVDQNVFPTLVYQCHWGRSSSSSLYNLMVLFKSRACCRASLQQTKKALFANTSILQICPSCCEGAYGRTDKQFCSFYFVASCCTCCVTVLDIHVVLFETFQSVEGLFIDFLIYGVPKERMSMSKGLFVQSCSF